MEGQFFTGYQKIIASESDSIENRYKETPFFDIEKGDFLLNGANQLVRGSGHDAWVLWCTKAILTQQSACAAYSDAFGIDSVGALRYKDKETIMLALENTITKALMADPMGRTKYVRDFHFVSEGDSMHVTCTVIGVNGGSAELRLKLDL